MLNSSTTPRRQWCTSSCGNRARVTRHHERKPHVTLPGAAAVAW
ncbi:CGNR zinc finger domain-containing protein [Streptomyces sp. LN785]